MSLRRNITQALWLIKPAEITYSCTYIDRKAASLDYKAAVLSANRNRPERTTRTCTIDTSHVVRLVHIVTTIYSVTICI